MEKTFLLLIEDNLFMDTKVLCGRTNRNMVEGCQGPPCRWRALGNPVDAIEVSWQTGRGMWSRSLVVSQ